MNDQYVKIIVYVPCADGNKIREILNQFGAGQIGNYDYCSFSVKGVGRFRGRDGSNPSIGLVGKIEEVEEERIETICPKNKLEMLVKAIKVAHPYEEPVIDIYPLISL